MRKALIAILCGLVVLSVDWTGAAADSSQPDPQKQLQLIDQIRSQLGSDLADAIAAQEQLRKSLEDNSRQQQQLEARINDVEAKIAALDVQIGAAQRREADLARRIEAEREQLSQLARAIYVSPGSALLMLAESQSLGDLLTRISDLNIAGSRASQLKDALKSDLAELKAEREKEQAARDDQVTQKSRLASQLAQLRALQVQQERSMGQLQLKIEQTQSELARLKTQSVQLAQEVTQMLEQQQDAIIAAAMQAVWAQLQLWLQSNGVGPIPTSAGHSTRYRFIWPEPSARVSQPFGPTNFWFEPPYGGYPHFHTGIDLVEPFGSPVYAADDGVVALVGGSTSGYGNYVVLAHSGGFDTLYGHLSTTLVKVGQVVTQGAVVGLEGSSGNSTGAHLHFELRIGQAPVNPTPYLPPGPPSAYRQ